MLDLLRHRPRRHEDRRELRTMASLQIDEACTVRGEVVAQGVKYWRQRQRSVCEVVLSDGTGRLHCRWWDMPYLEGKYPVGQRLLAHGKISGLKPPTMDHPEIELLEAEETDSIHMGRLVPVYPLTEGISQRWLRSLIWRTVQQYAGALSEPWPAGSLGTRPSRGEAIRGLHFPASQEELNRARERLALDELLELQWELQERRQRLETKARTQPCPGDNRLMRPFLAALEFKLTEAQTRALRELRADLGRTVPMRRLLQGDVGCGKTVVAACCALMVMESGRDVLCMAPTEILAEQHFQRFAAWFGPLGLPVRLVTGARQAAARAAKGADGESRPPELVVGTHALLERGFEAERLGLVVIDEQHKFGVTQRERLLRKGHYPHLLVMTATPIPRTLGLTLYGDLDVSVIEASPAGRGRVRTYVREAAHLDRILAFVRQKLGEGRQACVVCPRIEQTELKSQLRAAREELAAMTEALKPHAVGLLHGRLPMPEKERVMTEFRAGRLKALVATSVIEVGIDVPNATIMLIRNAEAFGLAQLHQLRGRIGRGAHDSTCILLADTTTPEARQRLEVLARTRDGFEVAEADLQLRGPGEFLGQQQSGLPGFRFADLRTDLALVREARDKAREWLKTGSYGRENEKLTSSDVQPRQPSASA